MGKHLATLDLHQMRQQPIYAFFEEDSTLNYFPAWQREYLRLVRDDCNAADLGGTDGQRSP